MEDGKVIVKKVQIVEEAGEAVRRAETEEIQEMRILVSGMLHKEDRTFVRVSFLRGKDWAEGIVPDGVIEKSEGFTQEEISKLQDYLVYEREMLLKQAKGVNPIRNMLDIG